MAQPALPRPNFDSSSFTFQAPSFPLEPTQFTTNAYPQLPRYEFTVGQEKAKKTPEQEEITRKMRSTEQSLKNIQGLSGQKGVSYADLCMFPHVHLPLGFKTPKFEKYDGHGDPIAHLKRYCNQLRGAGGKEELLMAYFGETLVGIASEWYMDQDISRWHIWDDLARDFVSQFQYNIDIAPDRNSLSNLKKKSSESFREYAVKWPEQAARVKPPMDETEMSAISTTSQAIQGGSGGVANRNKKEEVAMATLSVRKPRSARLHFSEKPPQHDYPHQDAAYAMDLQPYAVMNAQPYSRPQQQFHQNRAQFPRNQLPHHAQYNPRPPQNNFPYNARAREPLRKTNFTPIGESYSILFPKLVQMGLLQPVPPNRQNPESPSYQPGARCAYHSGVEGHDTESCWTLKKGFENLIEQKRIVLKDEDIPNVTNNSLPAHNNGPVIGMICEDKEFDPSLKAIIAIADVEKKPKADRSMTDPTAIPWNYNEAVVTYKGKEVLGEVNETNLAEKYLNLEEVNNVTKKRFPLKKLVSAEEAEEFFRKMKTADYEIIDQLQKSPAQVSLLSLLMNSTEHQKVLIKTLNEAYVPIETTVEQLERMAKRFFTINQISFSKNDLPPEGATHNKALHLIVKCEGYYVKRVMLDGGSGVDICPLSTLQRMEIETERIRPNNICVRAFDGIKRETIGEIDLILTIGPVDFEVTFLVLDMDTSYNFLLGRPWIHAAGVVPSTLHQMVKLEYEDQEIIVHGEDEQSIYRDPSVPCLEAREGSEHIVYQVFEVVVADQYEEGSPCPQPFLSKASVMVAKEMIRHGYKPGKGLGTSLQGITEPITLLATKKFFGVGFHATEADVMWANQ
ncbi:uncharacterized protein LOC142164571 [Nicotiana tabacum]|uniref:Uncharacterized protein LOC142164571 n=1 Tax=Nicotiana tabacum TaxID=4097 RepID=A0AC58S0P1_TOBAC